MPKTAEKIEGSTFLRRSPVVVMAPDSTSPLAPTGIDDLLQSFVRGERGRALRAQLSVRHPNCSADAIEEAIQYACKSFLDEAEGITAPGQVYAWIRTAAHRSLGHEADRHHRELVVDPAAEGMERITGVEDAGPADELIALEDDADLSMLVQEVSSSLSDRRREVLALYGAGYKRPQIAERLGLTEREVKRDLRVIMDQARATVARLAGGGCALGEPLVMRFICGISTPEESAKAREHLSHCARCEQFSERLIAWREKAGAVLPAPVVEGASPGVLGRIAESSTERLAAIKQHLLDGGAQVKQHATTLYGRAVDPTPLAAARPGAVGAMVASCIAIGGGATYCVEQGVDPLGAARSLIAAAPESEPEPATEPPEPAESPGPVYAPEPPIQEETSASEPAPPPASSEAPQEPNPEPPPPPEHSFEPVAPAYQSSESESEATYEAPAAPAPEPAPVPADAGPQFGGP